jgi:uncharacterized repeat protein (TIGR03833 family)
MTRSSETSLCPTVTIFVCVFSALSSLFCESSISQEPGLKSDSSMDGTRRINIHIGDNVDIVLKQDQRTSKLTRGTVSEILTSSQSHPHGIKVRLTDGKVGRVKSVNPP